MTKSVDSVYAQIFINDLSIYFCRLDALCAGGHFRELRDAATNAAAFLLPIRGGMGRGVGVVSPVSDGKYIKKEIKCSGYVGMIMDTMNRIDRIQIARPILFIL